MNEYKIATAVETKRKFTPLKISLLKNGSEVTTWYLSRPTSSGNLEAPRIKIGVGRIGTVWKELEKGHATKLVDSLGRVLHTLALETGGMVTHEPQAANDYSREFFENRGYQTVRADASGRLSKTFEGKRVALTEDEEALLKFLRENIKRD